MPDEGDNKEFAIANVADGDVTVYFFNPSGNTSANDTATEKYMDTNRPRTEFALRTDQTLLIVKINGRTLTDPITVPVNGSHTETGLQERKFMPNLSSMVLRTTVDNTNVKIRVRG